MSTDDDYLQESIDSYAQSPAAGPYTLAFSNSAVFLPLANITSSFASIATAVRDQINTGEFASYLPAGAAPSVVQGYAAILSLLADVYEHPSQPVFESPFQGPPTDILLLKPLSRGSVLIDPANPAAEPIFTYGTLANPLDIETLSTFIPFVRSVAATPSLQALGVVEVAPGAGVQTLDDMTEWLRESVTGSFQHPVGTASMLPQELGGVVGTDLKVHGFDRLRVVDASIIPVLAASHTAGTVYAIAEKVSLYVPKKFHSTDLFTKAADIIINEWSS